jgi:hypothetical protein
MKYSTNIRHERTSLLCRTRYASICQKRNLWAPDEMRGGGQGSVHRMLPQREKIWVFELMWTVNMSGGVTWLHA